MRQHLIPLHTLTVFQVTHHTTPLQQRSHRYLHLCTHHFKRDVL